MSLQKQSILDGLVHQFSDPLSFFRELIQNAIDAGSGEVEVSMEFEVDPDSDKREGTMVIEVDDFGEGMNREIIEEKLTRLFSSAKDDDYTKIGKFGIGFVSVFAIEPEAVCVDTGRTGESWRVLFDADKTYELYALDRPVEGTQVRIFKKTSRAKFQAFVGRARRVILQWCKHVPVPIYFQGKEIAAPFDVDSPCKIVHEEEGTRLVMGFVEDFEAPFGYYNRGLTLKEGDESPWPYVTFKIDSRYLEHTLTRDQILEDKNFHKAWALLEEFATERLPEKLADRIEETAARPDRRAEYEGLCELLVRWIEADGHMRRGWHKREFIATVDGQPVSLRECERRGKKGELLCARRASALTDRLGDEHLILRTGEGTVLRKWVRRSSDYLPEWANARYVFAGDAVRAPTDGAEALVEQVDLLVGELGGRPEWIGFKTFDATGACAERIAVLLDDRFEVTPAAELPVCTPDQLAEAHNIVFNAGDEHVRKLLRIARHEPEWAGFALVRLLVGEASTDELDRRLVDRAISQREEARRKQDGGAR
ncbi:MAG: ATP-binding protein [Persicimonas sp.]